MAGEEKVMGVGKAMFVGLVAAGVAIGVAGSGLVVWGVGKGYDFVKGLLPKKE